MISRNTLRMAIKEPPVALTGGSLTKRLPDDFQGTRERTDVKIILCARTKGHTADIPSLCCGILKRRLQPTQTQPSVLLGT